MALTAVVSACCLNVSCLESNEVQFGLLQRPREFFSCLCLCVEFQVNSVWLALNETLYWFHHSSDQTETLRILSWRPLRMLQ